MREFADFLLSSNACWPCPMCSRWGDRRSKRNAPQQSLSPRLCLKHLARRNCRAAPIQNVWAVLSRTRLCHEGASVLKEQLGQEERNPRSLATCRMQRHTTCSAVCLRLHLLFIYRYFLCRLLPSPLPNRCHIRCTLRLFCS